MAQYCTKRKIAEAENRTNREIARNESSATRSRSKTRRHFSRRTVAINNVTRFALSSRYHTCARRYGCRLQAHPNSQVDHVGASVSSCLNSQRPKGASPIFYRTATSNSVARLRRFLFRVEFALDATNPTCTGAQNPNELTTTEQQKGRIGNSRCGPSAC